MARKKTILKKDILKTAYAVVRKEGFKGITARNIANEMECSTQPIYLEFKNMNELKEHLYEDAQTFLYEEVLPKKQTGEPILDTCLNYIQFAKEERILFTALYLEGELPPQEAHEVSYRHFTKSFDKENVDGLMTKRDRDDLYDLVWPFVHGTASLIAQGHMCYDERNILKRIQGLIWNVLEADFNKPKTKII